MPNSHVASLFVLLAVGGLARADSVRQSTRELPIVREVDVVVVGSSVGAVAAAVEASGDGADVLLVAPRTYLGEDLAATLRLWLEDDESADGELTGRIFAGRRTTTPAQVKKTLDAALLEADVDFLLATYATDVLFDAEGNPAGLVVANRAGRQVVRAKVIVDAGPHATVARMARADFHAPTGGKRPCRRVVLGGESNGQVEPLRQIPAGVRFGGKELHYYEYGVEIDLGDGSRAARAEAEQQCRDLTYREGQLRAAERFTSLTVDRIRGRRRAADWSPQTPWAVDHFRSGNVDRLYVLGPAADLPPAAARRLMGISAGEALGRELGKEAARVALAMPVPAIDPSFGLEIGDISAGSEDVGEVLAGLRPTDHPEATLTLPEGSVPVLARADVVVVGGGTSGACAAIAAARQGAHVLVLEYQEGLGGVGTLGLIGKPYRGQNRGFNEEVPFCDKEHNTEYKMEWFRRQIRAAGGRIWFGVLGCGVVVRGDRVLGAVVATPQGRGAVLAHVVVDATGNGDVAVAAGAESMYGDGARDVALQGTGLPVRPLGKFYVNTDYLLVDESDLVDTRRALVGSRLVSRSDVYDLGTFIQTRERRRVLGDHVLGYLDQIAGRTYPDSIVLSGSDYDSHGYPSEPYFALIPHTEKTLKANHPAPGGTCWTPYRCLLPRGLDGILVAGLAISMHRDASAMVRMQKDMHNQGYAAGVAAAMACRERCTPREIDVDALQSHLVEIGNLPAEVLDHEDSFPLPHEEIAAAVARLTAPDQPREDVCRALAVVLSYPRQAGPLVSEAFAAADADARLTHAKLLGFLGRTEGVPVLIDALARVEAWDAKILQGNMAEYAHLPTPIDALILALGYSGDERAVEPLLEKLDTLDADVTLSHHRSLALALESLGAAAAAPRLAALLKKPGMAGHVMTELEPLQDKDREKRRRTGPLREIVLARALYRCGDHEGLGRQILESYRSDVRGLLARHAAAVLDQQP